MKRTLLAGLLIAVTSTVIAAQTPTSATYNARVEGTVNCRKVNLSVTRQFQNGGTTTTLAYAVLDCPAGSQTPSIVLFQGNQSIPNADYITRNGSHELQTKTANGLIQLRWNATAEHQNTFSGVWVEKTGNDQTRTDEQQMSTTARVDGVLGSVTLAGERPGWFTAITQTVK